MFSSSNILPSLQIRPIRLSEVNEVLALIHLSIRTLNTEHYSPETIEQIICLYAEPSCLLGTTFVAEYQFQLLGVVSAEFRGLWGTINAIFTHPDFVGKGIGRRLIQEIEKAALNVNVWVMTTNSSLTAVLFYQKLDYEVQGKTKIHDHISCVVLKKQLQPFPIQDLLNGDFRLLNQALPHLLGSIILLILIILL